MPSSFAKKQLEKFGWKEGEGLGKHAQGVNTFVRAHRPKGEKGEYIGIGHEASVGTSNSDMGYGKLLAAMKPGAGNSSSSESSRAGSQEPKTRREREGDDTAAPAARKAPRAERAPSTSSSSSSDGDGNLGDVTTIDDATLFARCGGVRLGRTGRHRFFDGKLARAEEHAQSAVGSSDPYAEQALPKMVDIAKKKGKKKKH